jgi:hypothetical protein
MVSGMIELPQATADWLQAQVGTFHITAAYRHDGTRSGVWRVESGNGEFIVKLHNRKLRWFTEVTAYQQWAVAYEPHVAKLCASYSDDHMQGILLSTLPGKPVRDYLSSEYNVQVAFLLAGRLCRRLADLAVGERFGMTAPDGTPVDYQGNANADVLYDPVKYLRHSFMAILEKANRFDVLLPAEHRLAQWALNSMELFDGEKPKLVNGDYTPGNWLCDASGALTGIIDLEHIAWDVEVAAVMRLESAFFPMHPSCKEAFYEGYGDDLSHKAGQLKILRIMHAIYRIGYGIETYNMPFLIRGRKELKQLAED